MATDLRANLESSLGDGFVVERELGGGGMSRVFIAHDRALNRHVVVKVLPAELVGAISVARFEREIGLAARLQHPHIMPLLSTGNAMGQPYYTMPFVEGESLRERLTRSGELPVAEAVRLLREIASALQYAHEQGIVHRDVKPENVLLSRGISLVTDFGVAKALAVSSTSDSGPLTATGIAVGTPAYMAPEQLTADPSTDHRADLYAFGLIAYELLAGQLPFAGRTAQALFAAHVVDTPEPLQHRRPSLPPALSALVMRCLEKRPSDRPQDAGEIIRALDAMTTPTGTVAAPRTQRRRTTFTVLAFAVVACVISVGAWFALHRTTPPVGAASPRLLIAPFENLSGDAQFDHVGRMAADRLALTVSQGSSMDVVPSGTVLMALRDTTGGVAARLKQLSEATHAGLLLSGTFVLRGDSLVLQAQVTDLRTGKVVTSLDPAAALSTDPLTAVDELGDRLRGSLAQRELIILPQGYRPPKNAAYQEFAKGYERFAVQGDFIGSRPFLERAIALDSNFTAAYLMLGRQYLNAGEYSRADSMRRRIERLPQGLNATERLILEFYGAELKGDIVGMLRAQQQLAARDSSLLSLELVGEAALWLLRPDLAIPALEYSEAGYLVMGGQAARGHLYLLANAYHLAGTFDRELRLLIARQASFMDVSYVRGRQLHAQAGLGQSAQAIALVDTLLRGTVDSSGVVLAYVAVGAEEFRAHGDPRTAAKLLEMASTWIVTHEVRVSSSDRQLNEGIVMLAHGMTDSARVRFASVARDSSRLNRQLDAVGYLALAQAARGDQSAARVTADSVGALGRPWLFGRNTYWRAAITGAVGDHDRAVELLRQANREGQQMHTWHYVGALDSLHTTAAFVDLVRPKR